MVQGTESLVDLSFIGVDRVLVFFKFLPEDLVLIYQGAEVIDFYRLLVDPVVEFNKLSVQFLSLT